MPSDVRYPDLGNQVWISRTTRTEYAWGAVPPPSGDITWTLAVTDNGNGTWTSSTATGNGDGTWTEAA